MTYTYPTLLNTTEFKLAHATYIVRDNPIAIRYYQTDIILFHECGTITLNTGGYRTHATKARLNEYANAGITQHDNLWFLPNNDRYIDSPYYYTDTLSLKECRKFLKRIKAYAKLYTTAQVVPFKGDCFSCALETQSKLRATHNYAHLLSHIDENYITHSLAYNALCAVEAIDYVKHNSSLWTLPFFTSIIKRAVYRYLKAQFGFVA